MNTKIIYGFVLLAIVQSIGKSQTTDFYPNDISDALNAYGNTFDAVGTARFIGMGGSMGALGGDLSAVEMNPAGLGVYRGSEASISASVLSNKNTASMGSSYSNSDTNFNFPSAGFVLALGGNSEIWKFNVGGSFSYQRLDNSVQFSKNDNINYQYPDVSGVDRTYRFESLEQYTNGYRSKANITFASNLQDILYLGIGLDWHYLNMDRETRYSHRNTVDGELMSFNEQLTPYRQENNGVGLRVGILGKITPEIRLAAAYHSPIWWSNMKYDYLSYTLDANNDIVQNYWYYDNYKLNSPGKIVLSGAFASDIINENNSLAVNLDFINYFNKDINFKSDYDYQLNNNFVNHSIQGSQEYRAGVEYRYKELKLRAGYAYASSPVKNKSVGGYYDNSLTSSIVYPKNYMAGEKNKLSFGAGYDVGPFFIDLAYQYIKSDYYTSFSGEYFNYYDNSRVTVVENDRPILGKVKNVQNNFILTLGMRF
ncbi:OmpP1/FadL family transporter [Apibacter sp. HY039]|uniref:OmpP1/FadL family transporter n=1 Tax=Apibacter sp. HY039 TaxID=2501476 RepID=UPI000FEB6654|nr:outer membrane protein transport protein [Apibacter sp. HY039]